MNRDPIAELVRLAEADITDFEARMQEVVPFYRVGDRVQLLGEVYEVAGFERGGMPGYMLRAPGKDDLFLPVDLEGVLWPVMQ
jgi:hypothetical protein